MLSNTNLKSNSFYARKWNLNASNESVVKLTNASNLVCVNYSAAMF